MAAPRITLRAQMTLLLKPRALERGGAETPNEGVGYIDHLDVSEVGQPDGEFSQPPNWEEELMFFSNLLDTPGDEPTQSRSILVARQSFLRSILIDTDKDGSGTLNEDEVTEAASAIRNVRVDNVGHAAYFLSGLFSPGKPLRELALKLLDGDADGEVTFDGFMQLDSSLYESLAVNIHNLEGHPEVVIAHTDFDGDGYISLGELHFYVYAVMSDVSFTHGHAQLAVMMADRDGDGKLRSAEMRPFLDGSYLNYMFEEPEMLDIIANPHEDDDPSWDDDMSPEELGSLVESMHMRPYAFEGREAYIAID
mmetsp:Transcript_6719/g.17533  ORF Transcript_6719/g.17533 Transcript_6719/m.17533 type:complete len:309 (+) Transcript_6719:204-1130(+)